MPESFEALLEEVRLRCRLEDNLKPREVVMQARAVLGVEEEGGTMREELVRLCLPAYSLLPAPRITRL